MSVRFPTQTRIHLVGHSRKICVKSQNRICALFILILLLARYTDGMNKKLTLEDFHVEAESNVKSLMSVCPELGHFSIFIEHHVTEIKYLHSMPINTVNFWPHSYQFKLKRRNRYNSVFCYLLFFPLLSTQWTKDFIELQMDQRRTQIRPSFSL